MKSAFSSLRHSARGMTMPDLLLSTALTAMLAAGMLTAIVALQKSTAASHHHVRSQLQQARLIDYIARDLRRAMSVKVETVQGSERLNVTIPDYYDAKGAPRDPAISNGSITYGSGSGSLPVSYYKSGDNVVRKFLNREEILATDVQSFVFDFTDSGEQAVSVSISFVPRFQFSSQSAVELREGTTTYATTLLRNKRIQ